MGDLLTKLMVVDMSTGLAGGYASKLLTDAGATVLKVEQPSGDPLRRYGTSDAATGQLFDFLHSGQSFVTLDVDDTDRRRDLLEILSDADILIESDTPGVLESRSLDHATLKTLNMSLTIVSLSPYGRGGPWSDAAGADITMLAQSGPMAAIRTDGREPVIAGARQTEWIAGAMAATCAVAAARKSRSTGVGDHLDLSMLELTLETCANYGPLWAAMTGIETLPPYDEMPSVEPSADGYVGFCIFTGQQWQDFALMLDQPEWIADESLMTMGGRNRRGAELRSKIHAWTTARTTQQILDEAEIFRVPAAPLGNAETLTSIEQFAARGVFEPNPLHGFAQPRVPYRVLERAPDAVRPAEPTMSANDLPLRGLRVLDLTQFWAGPYAGWVLAMLGAEVIHVESVQRPDGIRFAGGSPGTERWWERGPTFHATNTNKLGLTLELGSEEGRELLLQLVEKSDGFIENYSPRVIERFDLEWNVVGARNPSIVQVRMPAFGLDGPWRNRVGFAQTMEQLSGIAWLTGYADSAPRNSRACSDPFAGLHAAFAFLGGIHQRSSTGAGCCIEATMAETIITMGIEQLIEHHATGQVLTRDGNTVPGLHQSVFPVASADAGMLDYVAVASDAPLDPAIAEWCSTRSSAEVITRLRTLGLAVGAVADTRQGHRHPQHEARAFWQQVDHCVVGPIDVPTLPVRFGSNPDRSAITPAPTLGQHNHLILGGLLGLDADRLVALESAGVIGTTPKGS